MSTNQAHGRKPASLALLVVVAVVSALLVAASPSGHADAVDGHGHQPSTDHLRAAELAFHDQMRKLWEDHVTWTRLAIVTFADGSAGFDATAGRLLQNQADIGDAIEPYYGIAAGDRLTALLKDHITIAVELLQAAEAGDTAGFNDARARWYDNADEIADFLAAANPRSWSDRVLRAAMKTHLDQTLAEASAELQGDFPQSVETYEEIHHHILEMADLLSSGIIRQFPAQFRAPEQSG